MRRLGTFAVLCFVLAGVWAAPPAPAATGQVDQVGTFTITGPAPEDCPVGGYECSTFEVVCDAPYDAVPVITGRVAVGAQTGTRLRGIVMMFVGNEGMEFWGGTPERRAFVDTLHTRGYETLEIAWASPWVRGTDGYVALSCRPATAIEWGAGVYAASGATPYPGDGVCGFCLVGTSAGTAQVAFPLMFHGQAESVDAAVEISGPAEADLTEACKRDGTPFQYLEPNRADSRARVDGAWDDGDPAPGPCEADPTGLSFQPTWDANSLLAAAGTALPTTRVHFIWGARDYTGAVGQGMLFMQSLADAGTTMLDYDCMNGPHDIASNAKTLRQLGEAIEWRPEDGFVHAPPVPTPQLTPRCRLTRG